jgi:cellulose synthase/poly-beta-1,6-N-acetylglucosamine synthase-like glycosyltransferase
MNTGPGVALVISTFNQPDYLSRVLAAVARQTLPPAEVFLADDGSEPETGRLFAEWAAGRNLPAKHAWQKHEGFRKSRVLNEALAMAKSDYVVFLDGDTVPHPQFVADHRALATPGCFVQGHRALIGERAAARFGKGSFAADRRQALVSFQLSAWANAFRWPVARRSSGTGLRGIRGCNFAVWRADLLQVNGFNEAFTGWGREDAELAARLMNAGIRRLNGRGWALCYHLWHPPASRAAVPANDELLAATVREKIRRCEIGLSQHLPQQPA